MGKFFLNSFQCQGLNSWAVLQESNLEKAASMKIVRLSENEIVQAYNVLVKNIPRDLIPPEISIQKKIPRHVIQTRTYHPNYPEKSRKFPVQSQARIDKKPGLKVKDYFSTRVPYT